MVRIILFVCCCFLLFVVVRFFAAVRCVPEDDEAEALEARSEYDLPTDEALCDADEVLLCVEPERP